MIYPEIALARSKTETISRFDLFPEYRDQRFYQVGGITVFLAQGSEVIQVPPSEAYLVEGARYKFSDRMSAESGHGDPAAIDRFEELRNMYGGIDASPEYFQGLLSRAMGLPELDLVHIAVGLKENGHPYQRFGFLLDQTEL